MRPCVTGKTTPSSETSERAQSAKRDSLSSGEKDSSDSKATQVRTRRHSLLTWWDEPSSSLSTGTFNNILKWKRKFSVLVCPIRTLNLKTHLMKSILRQILSQGHSMKSTNCSPNWNMVFYLSLHNVYSRLPRGSDPSGWEAESQRNNTFSLRPPI